MSYLPVMFDLVKIIGLVNSPTKHLHTLVSDLVPFNELEAEHCLAALRWLERTDDIYRRVAQMTPPMHLVSSMLLVDPTDGSVLLVDHLAGAGLGAIGSR